MEDRRKKGILAGENREIDADRPNLFGPEPDPEEIARIFGRTDDNKGVCEPEQPFEDSDVPDSFSPDEEFPDQATTRADNPKILIESISPKAPKSHILCRLSEALPPLMTEQNETMVESILQYSKERFGLNGNHIKALRNDIEKARLDKLRSSESGPKSLEAEGEQIDSWLPIAAPLISSHNILDQVVEVLKESGLVGHEREAKIIYLALTSRVTDAPINILVKGASSAGKNHLVKQVLSLFPTSAFYDLSSMSDKAIIYWDEPIRHRHLVVYEAAGLNSVFLSYIIRSLLSEGKVRYWTGKKQIEKEGPTGFITTTTADWHPENETRMLTLRIDESPGQTQAVMMAQAKGSKTSRGDLVRFIALQRIIAIEKPGVIIPYGEKLAQAINPVAIRLRRDFPSVLNLIKAHALLHSHHRERDDHGMVMATLADYEAVYDLVADLLDAMVIGEAWTVDQKIEKALAAVTELCRNDHNQEGVNRRELLGG
jgi:hypothetical protein